MTQEHWEKIQLIAPQPKNSPGSTPSEFDQSFNVKIQKPGHRKRNYLTKEKLYKISFKMLYKLEEMLV